MGLELNHCSAMKMYEEQCKYEIYDFVDKFSDEFPDITKIFGGVTIVLTTALINITFRVGTIGEIIFKEIAIQITDKSELPQTNSSPIYVKLPYALFNLFLFTPIDTLISGLDTIIKVADEKESYFFIKMDLFHEKFLPEENNYVPLKKNIEIQKKYISEDFNKINFFNGNSISEEILKSLRLIRKVYFFTVDYLKHDLENDIYGIKDISK